MKTIGTMLCLASLLLLAACTAGPEEAAGTQDAPLPGAAVATCRVVDVQDDQLILAAADGGENDVYALALGDLPVTYEDPSQTEIVPGNQIQIGYGGAVEETFPARLGNVRLSGSRWTALTTCAPSTSKCSRTCGTPTRL